VQHELRVTDGVAFVVTSGVADVSGWVAMHEALIDHPDYEPGMPIVIDHSALVTAAVSADDARAIGDLVTTFDAREAYSPIAVVAPNSLGLSRIAQAQLGMWESRRPFQAFRDRDDALRWIERLQADGSGGVASSG
jgi:hypothetical protein